MHEVRPITVVRTQERACSSDSRFRRKLSGTTEHRLLGTQRPQMLCVAAWAWFCLSTEFMARKRTRATMPRSVLSTEP